VTNTDIAIEKYIIGRTLFLKEEKLQCLWRYYSKIGLTIITLLRLIC